MQLLEHFKELTRHPQNAEELKGLILQLAVQGKLTQKWREENPEVEPASVLFEKIKVEKERLIKEKKIKKELPLSKISGDETPYEIPRAWTWCRLIEVSEYIQRGKSPNYTEEPKFPVVSQKCVQWSGFDISKARFITEHSLEKYGRERFLINGDLLWNSTGDGTIGRVITYPGSEFEKVVADSHVTVVRVFKQFICTDYLWIFAASPEVQKLVAGRVSGSTKQTELSTGTVKSLEFSLPPLAEQKAIVEIVNQLFAEVEQLEALTKERIQLKADFVTSALNQLTQASEQDVASQWEFLKRQFGTFFTEKANIKKLREAILQLAVQGKLTHHWRALRQAQGPPLEHASLLLEKIKAEKEQLIKAGRIKKGKPLPPISEDEIPYELPEGWLWCRMNCVIMRTEAGKSLKCFSREVLEDEWGIIKTSAITTGEFLESENKYFSLVKPLDISKKINVGDFIYCRASGSKEMAGNSCVVKSIDSNLLLSDKTIRVITSALVFKEYVDKVNKSRIAKDYYSSLTTAKSTSMNNVTQFQFLSMPIPLPPIEEQKAIVEKVNGLMALCDQLEQEIETHHTTQEDWMQSCLREVV
ncbi:MAG: restriction endonuclease subunit S [Lunatimonas sp.]|uniref:restriction endonuclease subunit S n=1 Tax=Lunatimonas sp. TaxID=2060141 RepID=UPI00263ACCA0|nr:restriction endonuclease subunit S [Lunatimonas sp.]MCC5937713.1 restriction endonuclease subunit S [Lunatimonas sp.]